MIGVSGVCFSNILAYFAYSEVNVHAGVSVLVKRGEFSSGEMLETGA